MRETRRYAIDVTYAFETTGPLHLGTGHGAAGLDRSMLRDRDGLPYVPGSTLKGRARYAATRICRWMKLDANTDPVNDDPNNGPGRPRDIPSRVFGSAWHRSTLRFSDARTERPPAPSGTLSDDERRRLHDRAYGLREVRTGASRSRLLGTVSQGRLFHSEVAPPGLIFGGDIGGYLECGQGIGDFPDELLVLWLALFLMVEDGLGGNKSSGSGRLSWAKNQGLKMSVNGIPFAPHDDEVSPALELWKEDGAGA